MVEKTQDIKVQMKQHGLIKNSGVLSCSGRASYHYEKFTVVILTSVPGF